MVFLKLEDGLLKKKFGCKMRKSRGYYHESKEAIISSNIPSCTTLDIFASSRIVVVDLMLFKFKHFIVSVVITFIAALKLLEYLELKFIN